MALQNKNIAQTKGIKMIGRLREFQKGDIKGKRLDSDCQRLE